MKKTSSPNFRDKKVTNDRICTIFMAMPSKIELTYSDEIPKYTKPDPRLLLPSSVKIDIIKEELMLLVSR